jgi:hypothetical protein
MKGWFAAPVLLLGFLCGSAASGCWDMPGSEGGMTAASASAGFGFAIEDKGVHMTESFTAKDEMGCVLQVWVNRVSAIELELSYIFTNGTIRNAYIFNKLYAEFDDSGVYRTDSQLVNVTVEDGKVIVSKKIMNIPPRMKVERPNVPCVTKVPAGSKTQEIMRLPLPLKIWTPYTDDSAVPQSTEEKRLYFALGYFLSAPEGDQMVRTVQTSAGAALYFYPFSIGSQKVLEAGPASFSVPVFAR